MRARQRHGTMNGRPDQLSWSSGVLLTLSVPYVFVFLEDVAEPAARYTWPRQLGEDALGDVNRPQFGWIALAVLAVAAAAAILTAFIAAARGDKLASGIAALVMLVFSILWLNEARERSEDRRCVQLSYEETTACISSSAAMGRDALLWAGPAALAVVGYSIRTARAEW